VAPLTKGPERFGCGGVAENPEAQVWPPDQRIQSEVTVRVLSSPVLGIKIKGLSLFMVAPKVRC
jgi:hypothetical protein